MSKSLTIEVNDSADNLTIASLLSVEAKEKLGTVHRTKFQESVNGNLT